MRRYTWTELEIAHAYQVAAGLDEWAQEETGERRESLVRAARAWRQTAAELERHLPRRAC